MAKSKISASYDNSAPFYRKLITVWGGPLLMMMGDAMTPFDPVFTVNVK